LALRWCQYHDPKNKVEKAQKEQHRPEKMLAGGWEEEQQQQEEEEEEEEEDKNMSRAPFIFASNFQTPIYIVYIRYHPPTKIY
jgi:hypothetical protein